MNLKIDGSRLCHQHGTRYGELPSPSIIALDAPHDIGVACAKKDRPPVLEDVVARGGGYQVIEPIVAQRGGNYQCIRSKVCGGRPSRPVSAHHLTVAKTPGQFP